MRDHTKLRTFELADEMYGLTAQMRRSAVSVPSNIVEGCSRENQVEYLRFLEIAFASLRELHYQSGLSHRLGYFVANAFTDYDSKLVETEKVLSALIRSLRSPNSLQSKQPTA